MNDVKTIDYRGEVGSKCFKLLYIKNKKKKLSFYIKQFNPEEYYILKATNQFRFVCVDDFLEFKYAQYIFFNKELYSKEYLQKWLDFKITNNIEFRFLHKPFPPQYILDTIKIKDRI